MTSWLDLPTFIEGTKGRIGPLRVDMRFPAAHQVIINVELNQPGKLKRQVSVVRQIPAGMMTRAIWTQVAESVYVQFARALQL